MAHKAKDTSLEIKLTNKIVKIPSSSVKFQKSTILFTEVEVKWYIKGPKIQLWERQKQMSFQAQTIPALSEELRNKNCHVAVYVTPHQPSAGCGRDKAHRSFLALDNKYLRSTLHSSFPQGSVTVWMSDVLLTELREEIFTEVRWNVF